MSLPNYLAKIKSSGIYRFVWDKSEVAGVPAETLRLVVGYSEKGPFNTPTYIQSASEFIQIYGNINKKLERRGVYFHRLALQALTAGPILALNLKKFENETVNALSFAPNKSILDTDGNINIQKLDIEDIYDTNRFWVLDANKMQSKTENYISIAATDSVECSNTVFFRGTNVNGYDLTVKEWYSSATTDEIPSYFEGYENLKIEDFFAEVYVFRGKFTKEIASSKEMSKYFNVDEKGNVSLKRYVKNAFNEKVDALVALSQNENSNFVKRYEGILLPNFKDSQNQYISLDLLFNSDNYEHKMLMDFNVEMLENEEITVDTLVTTGYNNEKLTQELFDELVLKLSTEDYEKITSGISVFNNINIVPEITYVTFDGTVWNYQESDSVSGTQLYVYNIEGEDLNSVDSSKFGQLALQIGDRFLGSMEVENPNDGSIDVIPTTVTLTGMTEFTETETIEPEVKDFDTNATRQDMTNKFVGSKLSEENTTEIVSTVLDSKVVVDQVSVIRSEINVPAGTVTIKGKLTNRDKFDLMYYEDTTKSWETLNVPENGEFVFGPVEGFPVPGGKITGKDANYIQFKAKEPVKSELTLSVVDVTSGVELCSEVFNFEVVEKEVITKNRMGLTFDNNVNTFGDKYLVKYNSSLTADNSTLVPVYLEGYKLAENLIKPKSMKQWDKLQWQENILSVLTDYPGIRTALTSRQDVDYRYIVDTFEAYVSSECHAKLAIIAKEKENALAFLNFPSVYNFTNCEYSSFTNEKNRFQVKYIKEGANRLKNPSVMFSLVSEANGASYVSYNTPLTFTDGTVKTYVPSAALVSNNFMQKYTSRQPYYIVAGPNYGRIVFDGCVGPDYNFSRADLDILEPMGVNCMVYVPRKGTYINSNQTAKQNPVTALSKVHVRELVIFLQDEIEALLQNYQWEFNTKTLRDTVKAKADVICENVKANGGIYAFVNTCDESNNTNDIIDNEMLVLSTEIEPGRGAGKMVHELTIHKTGGLTAVIK